MAEPAIQTVSLDQITLDDRAWPREQYDADRLVVFAEMIADAREQAAQTRTGWIDPLPPLVVVGDGRGGYVLADGRHRYMARRLLINRMPRSRSSPRLRGERADAGGVRLRAGAPVPDGQRKAAHDRRETRRDTAAAYSARRPVRPCGCAARRRLEQHGQLISPSLCDSHTGGEPAEADGTERPQPNTGREPLRWEVAARQLAEDAAELLASCRKLLGGADFKSAGRELYDALAHMYGDEDALEVIDELSTVVGNARAHARKVAQVE